MAIDHDQRRQDLAFWEHDPKRLVVGLEQESFLFQTGGSAPSLSETNQFFESLCRRSFNATKLGDNSRPLAVGFDTETGYVAVKNDFCTHVIEAAFPPLKDPELLSDIYQNVWSKIREAAQEAGLILVEGGLLDKLPKSYVLLPHERRERILTREMPSGRPFTKKLFNIMMCSTQIHLNIHDEYFYKHLRSLYSVEYMFPLIFSSSRASGSVKAHCARPLMWRDAFVDEYRASGIPIKISETRTEYEEFLLLTSGFFRDYSFISPRHFGSVEFRVGCAQPDLQTIIEMVSLRLATTVAAMSGAIEADPSCRDHFYGVCLSGIADPKLMCRHLRAVESILDRLPSQWTPGVVKVMDRMRKIIAAAA